MRTFCSLFMIMIALGLASDAFGQAPRYEPYGAWRGRIRYVEGPYRTRTRIRWGGGLTPVGGQVLTTFATVAGNVATDPNFWSGVAGAGGASGTADPTRDAELNPQLIETINGVQEENRRLLGALNEIRALPSVKLQPLQFVAVQPPVLPADSAPGTTPAPDGAAAPGTTERIVAWNKNFEAIEAKRKEIGRDLNAATKIAETAGIDIDPAKAASAKQAAMLSVFGDALMQADALPITPEQFDKSYAAAAQGIMELKALLTSYIETGRQLIRDSLATPERQEKIKQAEDWLAQCQMIQL